MIMFGDANWLGFLFAILIILLIYWIAKFIISIYTGA